MFKHRGDHAVDLSRQCPRRLQTGDVLMLEIALYMGLNAGELPPKGRDCRGARPPQLIAQQVQGVGKSVGFRRARNGHRSQRITG